MGVAGPVHFRLDLFLPHASASNGQLPGTLDPVATIAFLGASPRIPRHDKVRNSTYSMVPGTVPFEQYRYRYLVPYHSTWYLTVRLYCMIPVP